MKHYGAKITGVEVGDDSLTGEDIKDGSIYLVDLNQEVRDLLNDQPTNGTSGNTARSTFPSMSGTSTMPSINITPTVLNGTQIATIPFVLNEATSEVHISLSLIVGYTDPSNSDYGSVGVAVFRDNICIGGGAIRFLVKHTNSGYSTMSLTLSDFPGDVNSHTYTVRVGKFNANNLSTTGVWYTGRLPTQMWGGVFQTSSSIHLMEVTR